MRDLRLAVYYAHDLALLSSLSFGIPRKNHHDEAVDDNEKLIELSPDLSFSVDVERRPEHIFPSRTSVAQSVGPEMADEYIDYLVLRNLDMISGCKVFVVHKDDCGPSRMGPCVEKYGRYSQCESFAAFDPSISESESLGWICSDMAQIGTPFLWLFADPEAETEDGRLNRKNLDNRVLEMVRFVRSSGRSCDFPLEYSS